MGYLPCIGRHAVEPQVRNQRDEPRIILGHRRRPSSVSHHEIKFPCIAF
jgi:hypothetical protein